MFANEDGARGQGEGEKERRKGLSVSCNVYGLVYRIFHQMEYTVLNSGRIQEAADAGSDGVGRQRLPELAADHAGASVGPRHLSENHPVVGPLLQGLGLVDVGKPLPQVKVCLLLGLDSLQLDQGGVVVLVDLGPLEAKELSGDVQSNALATHVVFCADGGGRDW